MPRVRRSGSVPTWWATALRTAPPQLHRTSVETGSRTLCIGGRPTSTPSTPCSQPSGPDFRIICHPSLLSSSDAAIISCSLIEYRRRCPLRERQDPPLSSGPSGPSGPSPELSTMSTAAHLTTTLLSSTSTKKHMALRALPVVLPRRSLHALLLLAHCPTGPVFTGCGGVLSFRYPRQH